MDYIHHKSIPATLSNLEVFSIPPTQLAIDSHYEVAFRPTSTIDSAKTFDIQIPASEDFTDLAETMIYAKVQLKDKDGNAVTATDNINVVPGFGCTLFDQIDFYLGSVNIAQSNGLYHYQAFFEDFIFRHPSKADAGSMWDDDAKRKDRLKKPFDLYMRLHNPLVNQNNLLLNNIPMLLRLTKSSSTLGVVKGQAATSGTETKNFYVHLQDIAVHIRRVKINPEASIGIQEGLEKAPANYFVTRNEVKSFVIPQSNTSMTFESVFSGVMPRRMLVGFVSNDSFSGKSSPFKFDNFKINSISTYLNGQQVPSIAYTPNFSEGLFMREFVNLYRFTNQNQGIPMLKLKHDQYKSDNTLFAFDYAPDGALGAETGTLSLLKRGNIKLEVKFSEGLSSPLHMIVFAQFDNMIQVDKYRNINTDW